LQSINSAIALQEEAISTLLLIATVAE